MIISHKYKFIFFANVKTGSTSIENCLKKYGDNIEFDEEDKRVWGDGVGKHIPPRFFKKYVSNEIWNTYFKFGFIRNPLEWFKDKERYMNGFVDMKHFRENEQQEFFSDEVNYLGKFEDIDNEFNRICGIIGIPETNLLHLNAHKSKLIFTITIGEDYQRIAEMTHPFMRQYANKIGARFVSIKSTSHEKAHWEKFRIADCLNEYDRVIFMDTDMFVTPNCPDLFALVPEHQIGMFNQESNSNILIDGIMAIASKVYKMPVKEDANYYNSGLIVASKCHKEVFKSPPELYPTPSKNYPVLFYDEPCMNLLLAKAKENTPELMFDLGKEFNCIVRDDHFEERDKAHIIHYATHTPNVDAIERRMSEDMERRGYGVARTI